jgi:diguanylate cyclase (GGDEF)-like protein
MTASAPARLPAITDDQVQALADPAFVTDPAGMVAVWNRAAAHLLGYSSAEAVGSRCATLLDGVGPGGAQVCTHPCPMLLGLLPTRRSQRNAQRFGRHPDMLTRDTSGERASVTVIAVPVTIDDDPMLLHLLRAQPFGERDSLTGALNRDAFTVRALDEQNRAARLGSALALALVDVDGLKSINDGHGHPTGDRVLSAVAATLRAGRRSDLVGRWGGDEFAVLLPDTCGSDAVARLQRSLDALKQSVTVGGRSVTCSGGVVEMEAGVPFPSLMQRADATMYRVKRSGRGRVLLDGEPRSARRPGSLPRVRRLQWEAGTASKMMSARLLAALTLLTVGVVACGGSDTPIAPTSSSGIGIAGGRLGTAAVIISATDQNTFNPVMQDATVGEIIEWKNIGSVTHNLVFSSDASISDPVLASGGVWQVKFTVAGVYQYSCTIHYGMVGTIVVRPG